MTPLRGGTLVAGLCLVAAGATARADAPFDSTAALERARVLRAAVSQGDAATLWAAFTERMRTAMGDSAGFAAKNRSMSAAMGAIDSVLSEEVRLDGDRVRVAARCRFANPPMPLALVMSFTADGRLDQAPGSTDPEHPVGNGMAIDHGNGEFSLFAHLSPGTLRVKAGDRVKLGQELGRCGNSGNTSEPHLHYHLQNGPTMSEADGLPARFHELMVDGKPANRVELLKGQRVRPGK